jgi:AcrR family transcriptional regulator
VEREFRFRLSKIRNLSSGYKWGYPHFMTTLRQPAIPGGLGCPEKPLRADARRNRERILKAARAVFGDHGMDAQIDDVAKRAKVGVGTVYRHFPTKEVLLDALVRERFEEIAGYAEEALQREDAWEGFCELIWRAAERNAVDRAFCDIVAFTDQSRIVEETGLAEFTEVLMDRAKAQGKLRADATQMDIPIMMSGCGSVMRIHPSPEIWRRYLTIMLDGLRAS